MIDKLKQRIQRLIEAYETEKAERKRLQAELEKSMSQNEAYEKQITDLERTIDNLKLADAFKAGNADNTSTHYASSFFSDSSPCRNFFMVIRMN